MRCIAGTHIGSRVNGVPTANAGPCGTDTGWNVAQKWILTATPGKWPQGGACWPLLTVLLLSCTIPTTKRICPGTPCIGVWFQLLKLKEIAACRKLDQNVSSAVMLPCVLQIYFYHNVRCRAEMYDMDIVMLQVGDLSASCLHMSCYSCIMVIGPLITVFINAVLLCVCVL